MADKKRNPKAKKQKRYLFKVTVVGPDDSLLEKVLGVVNENVVAVDGVRIGTTDVETDDSQVKAVTWSPRHTALDVLLSVTFKGANAVVIVLRDEDSELEAIYRKEIEEHLGPNTPTRVFTVGSGIDDFKQYEILSMFEDLFEEVLESKQKESKDK